MKKLLFLAVAFAAAVSAFAGESAELFPIVRNRSKFTGCAVVDKEDKKILFFQMASPVTDDVDITNIYVHSDNDTKTGRAKVGNEYYIAPAKRMISTYAKDGKGTLCRNAVEVIRQGNWYILKLDPAVFTCGKLSGGSLSFTCGKMSGRVDFLAKNSKQVEVPSIAASVPAAPKKAAPAKKKSNVKAVKSGKVISGRTVADCFPVRKVNPYKTVDVWITDGLERIENASDTTGKQMVEVVMPRNATEDFQVAIWHGLPARGSVNLTWGKLTDASGKILKGGKITMYRVIGVPFDEPMNPKVKYKVSGYGRGPLMRKEIFDRLTPYHAGAATGGYKKNISRTLTIFRGNITIPADAAAGVYSCNLTMSYPSGKQQLQLKVKVDQFALPERPSFVMFADLPRLVNYTCNLPGVENSSSFPNAMTMSLEKCLWDMSEHRIAIRSLKVKTPMHFDTAGNPVIDFSGFDKVMAYVLDELKMNPRLEMPLAVVSSGHGNWYTKQFGPINYTTISDEFKVKYTKTLRAVLKHLRAKKWENYFFAYYSDEPARDQMQQTYDLAKLIKDADPSLVPWIYGPGPTEALLPVINTWMGGYGAPLEAGETRMEEVSPTIATALKRGDRIGVYNPHEAYILNAPSVYVRTLYWWAYKQNLYWMSQYCMAYFTTGPQDLGNRRYWHYWVYPPDPGKSDIWEKSVRYEVTRSGLNDYEYLKAIELKTAELKKQIPAAKELSDRAIALEFANAVCARRGIHTGDHELFRKVYLATVAEFAALSDDFPALVNLRYDGGKAFLDVYARSGAVVKAGSETKTAAGKVLTFALDGAKDFSKVNVEVRDGSRSKIFVKNILPEYK